MNFEMQRLILQNQLIGSTHTAYKAKQILELGCGPGITTMNLARANPNSVIYGLDYDGEYINYAQRIKKVYKIDNVNFLLKDVRELSSFSSDKFDLVFCQFLFNQLNNPRQCINEIYRVLKPDGKLIVLEGINKHWEWPSPTREEKEHLRLYTDYQKIIGNNPNIALELSSFFIDKFIVEPSLELVAMSNIPDEFKFKLLRLFLLRMYSEGIVDKKVLKNFKERLFRPNYTSYTYILKIAAYKA